MLGSLSRLSGRDAWALTKKSDVLRCPIPFPADKVRPKLVTSQQLCQAAANSRRINRRPDSFPVLRHDDFQADETLLFRHGMSVAHDGRAQAAIDGTADQLRVDC